MKKSELNSLVNTEIDNAYGAFDGDLSGEIAEGIDFYLGEPFGNEEDGKSSVISRDVMDVIEWIMPSLMRVFTSSERAVVFDPVDPSDEDAAKQETDIVNHVFYKENDGFLNIYTWFKDALLSKNGIMKVWWDPSKNTEREEYKNLTDMELQVLLSEEDVDPIEHTENDVNDHDLTILRTTSNGCAKVKAIPYEEFLISKDADCILASESRFCAHKTLKTRSELIEMGFSKSKVNKIPQFQSKTWIDNEVRLSRDYLTDDQFSQDSTHSQTELIEVHECYYRVDFDGDGIAELRQITLAGGEILLNEEADRVPFIAITPVILTHKFYGMSIADMVKDIQLIKSTLMRQILDNTYLANNQRTGIQDGMVNLDDLLTSRSGGVVRTLGPPSQVMTPLPYNPLPPQTMDVMGMMDNMRKERTGVSQDSMGLESNVLAHGRTGVINQSYDMARMRTELIARIFAEVGMKPLMRELHAILQKNQNKEKWVQIRGKWIEIRPDEWKTRYNMTVNVGLGSGNKDRQMQSISQILAMQEKLLQTGRGITEQNVYNALEKLVEYSGLGDVNEFFTDPSTQPPPSDEPSTEEKMAMAQLQLAQQDIQSRQVEADTNRQEAIWRHEEKMKELIDKDQRERYKIELEYQRNIPGGLNVV
jgi:hypothetical protein